ncbi:MAG: chaperonin GroES [Chlamydiales bacterium]|jgi:chaperonin GroES
MAQAKQATKIQPLGKRVLIQRLEAEETLKGGIILPDTAKKKQELAKVVALGTGKKTKDGKTLPFPVKVNDRVLIEKYSGQEVSFEDEDFVIISSDDIVAVVEA